MTAFFMQAQNQTHEQTEDGTHREHEVKNSNLVLLLRIPRRRAFISFLNLTPIHFGNSELITNTNNPHNS